MCWTMIIRATLIILSAAGSLSGCGRAISVEVSTTSEISKLVGQKYVVSVPVELYEISHAGGSSEPVDFAEIVVGQGYIDSLVRSRKNVPVGTIIEVRKVALQLIPFETTYVLLVSMSPPQVSSDVEVRLVLRGSSTMTGIDLNTGYFSPLK